MQIDKSKDQVRNSDRLNIIKDAKASGYTGSYLELFEQFRSQEGRPEGHIDAESTRDIRQGLEGAKYGTSATLEFPTLDNHMLEGRQDYAIKVNADGVYQGILNPGDEYFMVDTSSDVDEVPVLKYGGIPMYQSKGIIKGKGTDQIDLTGVRPLTSQEIQTEFLDPLENEYLNSKESSYMTFNEWMKSQDAIKKREAKENKINLEVTPNQVTEESTEEETDEEFYQRYLAFTNKDIPNDVIPPTRYEFRESFCMSCHKFTGMFNDNVPNEDELMQMSMLGFNWVKYKEEGWDEKIAALGMAPAAIFSGGAAIGGLSTVGTAITSSPAVAPWVAALGEPMFMVEGLTINNMIKLGFFVDGGSHIKKKIEDKEYTLMDAITDPSTYMEILEMAPLTSIGVKALSTLKIKNLFPKTTTKLTNAQRNISDAYKGTRGTGSKQQVWNGSTWVPSKQAEALKHIKDVRAQVTKLKADARVKVTGAKVELKQAQKEMDKLLKEYEILGFDTKALQSEGFLEMFTEYNKLSRTAKTQKQTISKYVDEFYEMKEMMKGGDEWDFLLDQINQGKQIDLNLIKQFTTDLTPWEIIKEIPTRIGEIGETTSPLKYGGLIRTGGNSRAIKYKPVEDSRRKYQGDEGSGIVGDSTAADSIVVETPVVDDDYTFTRGDYQVSDTDISGIDFNLLYTAIQRHEHRGAFKKDKYKMKEDYNPFTRTTATGSGSSAYGPLQLTNTILSDITTPGIRRFYDVENMDTDFHEDLVEQSDLFLKYGGGDYKKFIDENTELVDGMTQQEIIDLYEYSGIGTLGDTDEEREKYKTLAIQILEGKYRKSIEEGGEGDDYLFNMLKEFGTGTDKYSNAVIKHYNKLKKLKEKKKQEENYELQEFKKREKLFPGMRDDLLRQMIMKNFNKA